MMRRPRVFRSTSSPRREGYLKCSTDIAKHGRKFAEDMLLTMAQFNSEPFSDGYQDRFREVYS